MLFVLALVENIPLDDGRVVLEPTDCTCPFRCKLRGVDREILDRLVLNPRPCVAVVEMLHHVLQNDHTKTIRVKIPAIGVNLLMQSNSVHAELFQRSEVERECGISGRGVLAVGPEALV